MRPRNPYKSNGFLLRALGLLALSLALASSVACSSREREEARQEARARPAPALPADASMLWSRNCALCHRMAEMHGKGVDDIHRALREVQAMRRYRNRLSEEQIEAIAALIAEETGGGAPAVSPSAE